MRVAEEEEEEEEESERCGDSETTELREDCLCQLLHIL